MSPYGVATSSVGLGTPTAVDGTALVGIVTDGPCGKMWVTPQMKRSISRWTSCSAACRIGNGATGASPVPAVGEMPRADRTWPTTIAIGLAGAGLA